MTVKAVSRSWVSAFGNTDEIASAAEAPQIATAPAVKMPNGRLKPAARALSDAEQDGERDRDDHQDHRGRAELHDLADGDLRAKEPDGDPQDALGGELDAGDARALLREEIEGHAEQQREQHDRSAIALGQEGRGHGDDQADQHAGK